jgi:hypothetical protein
MRLFYMSSFHRLFSNVNSNLPRFSNLKLIFRILRIRETISSAKLQQNSNLSLFGPVVHP